MKMHLSVYSIQQMQVKSSRLMLIHKISPDVEQVGFHMHWDPHLIVRWQL